MLDETGPSVRSGEGAEVGETDETGSAVTSAEGAEVGKTDETGPAVSSTEAAEVGETDEAGRNVLGFTVVGVDDDGGNAVGSAVANVGVGGRLSETGLGVTAGLTVGIGVTDDVGEVGCISVGLADTGSPALGVVVPLGAGEVIVGREVEGDTVVGREVAGSGVLGLGVDGTAVGSADSGIGAFDGSAPGLLVA
jgi:hypothetical protein